jgi:hypothetical protein
LCSENFEPRAQVQFEILGLPNGWTRFRRRGLAFKIRVIFWRCRRSFLGSSSYAASSHKESQRSTSLASIRSPPYISVQPGVPIKVAPGFFISCARKVRPAPRRRKFREAFQLSLLGRASLAIAMPPTPPVSLVLDASWTPFRRFSMADSDVDCWPRSERERYAMWILSKPSVCPNCANTVTHRARRKGFLEQILHVVFFVSPLRCEFCDERYFRVRFLTAPSAHKHHHAA